MFVSLFLFFCLSLTCVILAVSPFSLLSTLRYSLWSLCEFSKDAAVSFSHCLR